MCILNAGLYMSHDVFLKRLFLQIKECASSNRMGRKKTPLHLAGLKGIGKKSLCAARKARKAWSRLLAPWLPSFRPHIADPCSPFAHSAVRASASSGRLFPQAPSFRVIPTLAQWRPSLGSNYKLLSLPVMAILLLSFRDVPPP